MNEKRGNTPLLAAGCFIRSMRAMRSSCLDINPEGKRRVRLCLRPCLGVYRNVAFVVIALWSRSFSNSGMTSFHARIPSVGDRVPDSLRTWMAPFRPFFTAPVWERALVLLMGAMLAPGLRTVSSALCITGRAMASNVTCYHQGPEPRPLEQSCHDVPASDADHRPPRPGRARGDRDR